jgi:CO/xanthine dehydrogenase FAD-binding subunit
VATREIFIPESCEAALALLNEHGPDLFILGGGTVGMALINEGVVSPSLVMSLYRAKLNDVRTANGHLEIGATTTLTRVMQLTELPLLATAARHIGGWAIRNMATLAGNLFAPPPAGDAAVALLALDAEAIVSRRGSVRKIPLARFFTGRGQTALRPDELVTRINVPRPAGRAAFLKLGRRSMNTPAVVTVAVRVLSDGRGICTDARIALGAAGDHPLRATEAEAALQGNKLDRMSIADAAELAVRAAHPFSDALASEWYRRKMVGVHVRRALQMIGG